MKDKVNFRDKYLKPKRVLNSKVFVDSDDLYIGSGRGFTIVELMIYIVIFGIVGTLVGGVLSLTLKGRASVARSSEVGLNMERAFAQMVERVRAAKTITDASSTMNLEMADAAKNPTIFALSNGAITIKEGSGSAVSTTPSIVIVTNLTFLKVTNPAPSTSSVQIKMTAGYNNDGSADPATITDLQTTAMPL